MALLNTIRPGVYSGVITARSSESPGVDHTYTVWIAGLQLEFAGVSPQRGARDTDDSDDIDLHPFIIGYIVVVHVIETGTGIEVVIADRERAVLGPC